MAGIPGVASASDEGHHVSRVGPARRMRHLSRRFFGALSRKHPSTSDVAWATGFLLPAEAALWTQLGVADQRHSIAEARRFVTQVGESSRDDVAAALLHDIGKLASGLGNLRRTHKDFADVVELIAIRKLDSSFARYLHGSLRNTFRELVRNAQSEE